MWKKSTLRNVLMPLVLIAGTSVESHAAGPITLSPEDKGVLQGIDDELEFRQQGTPFAAYHQTTSAPDVANARTQGTLCVVNNLQDKMNRFAKHYGYAPSAEPKQSFASRDAFYASNVAREIQELIFTDADAYDKVVTAAAVSCAEKAMVTFNWPLLPEIRALRLKCNSMSRNGRELHC